MYCMKCGHSVGNCTCPNIQERLAAVGQGSHTAARFCKKCNQHYARCQCAEPEWVVRGAGQEWPYKEQR